MSGFDGWKDAQKKLKQMIEMQHEQEMRDEKECRIMRGEITLDDLEEYYQDIKSRVSPAYFSGSEFNVGDSFKTWYYNSKHAQNKLSCAFLLSGLNSYHKHK